MGYLMVSSPKMIGEVEEKIEPQRNSLEGERKLLIGRTRLFFIHEERKKEGT